MEDERCLVARGRSRTYLLLAKAFLGKPSAEYLAQVRDGRLLDALQDSLSEEYRSAIEGLRGVAMGPSFASAGELEPVYESLFRVPVPGRYVPPYESCFREGAGAIDSGYGDMWGSSSCQVNEFYARNRLKLAVENLPSDHVGVELLFMSKMCELEAQAIKEGEYESAALLQYEELQFLESHLIVWLPRLARKVGEVHPGGFYAHLAWLAAGFAEGDADYLGEASFGVASIETLESELAGA